ncbi:MULTISPECIES: PTS system trehalose-specific EIIBC component [Paenibacillus]|uniref:PTS system trehalose-specific EIIBC component n=1 Tax=Paenibacillus TaxID=44249 RepID=UPI0005CDE306|nr:MULTISPECIES: PTS system trehalose-specific EIIBC component [Paenibacillus]KAE8559649.1 PTS beta-glucoside transporter subunit EIIBCA [Paenibacillus polymyxa]KJD38254.1 PTS beta-glucoside transporter subunit IIABC [Paenibacillus polymyxa]MCJ1222148.1 PTS system trehalose-specific EIIBC component [Paenibacillus polymyxa]MDU8674401.1 PTS system trehalose-specific EIIBC component [Paenibacillus polymyxa]MDU8699309.1 PTS system trehalose-specific EIIBC component [Paenibacillus polymyxa]
MAIERAQVEDIIKAVGGKDNIEASTHCVTRLRFALYDDKLVDKEALEQNDLVKGQFSSQGQYQVVIGPGLVDKVYDEMISITGGSRASKDDVKNAASKKQNPIQRAIKTLADIFIPILPAIVTAGLLLGINNILTGNGIFFEGMSLVQVYPQWTDFAAIINTIASTAFTFLPALIGWSAVVRFGGSPLLGIVLGLILVHPDLLSAYSYADAVTKGTVPVWDLFGWHVNKIGYQGQVLPVLVSAYVLAQIEKFLNKKIADSFKLLLVAPITLLITGFLAFTVIGPVTFMIGNAITSGLVYVFDLAPALGGLIYGGFYSLLVITGMHHTFLAVDVQLIGTQGGTFLWPMLALSNIAQGAGALAMMLVLKEQKGKGLALTSSVSAFLGVTEPAIFGVNIRYKYPFVFGMIGSGIAGILLTVNHVLASSIGVGGIPGFLSIFPNNWGVFFIGMAIVLIVPFALTFMYGKLLSKRRQTPATPANDSVQKDSGRQNSALDVLEVKTPVLGHVVPLEQVPDQAFAERQMGQGIAVEPRDGRILAPFSGKVIHILVKSKHALILEHPTGVQILVHVGINTVSLKGEGFTMHVETGQTVEQGQLLMEFDRELIQKSGYPIITPVIVPDGQNMIESVEELPGEANDLQYILMRIHLNSSSNKTD